MKADLAVDLVMSKILTRYLPPRINRECWGIMKLVWDSIVKIRGEEIE